MLKFKLSIFFKAMEGYFRLLYLLIIFSHSISCKMFHLNAENNIILKQEYQTRQYLNPKCAQTYFY